MTKEPTLSDKITEENKEYDRCINSSRRTRERENWEFGKVGFNILVGDIKDFIRDIKKWFIQGHCYSSEHIKGIIDGYAGKSLVEKK